MNLRTYSAKPSDIQRNWFVVDAKGLTLGRVATRIATLLQGKHKPIYSPNLDTGDAVIVINAAEVRVTGNKMKGKLYHRHTGFVGGLKTMSLEKMLDRSPCKPLELAIGRMMPKGPLGRDMMRKLHLFAGSEHNHQAQQPVELKIVE